MVESFSLCKLLYEAGADCPSYGCIREIFESRYLRGVADEPGGAAAAAANVHTKNIELKLEKHINIFRE